MRVEHRQTRTSFGTGSISNPIYKEASSFGTLVPKNLARSGSMAAVLDMRSMPNASQAQHDA
jgi:hypothetical protein